MPSESSALAFAKSAFLPAERAWVEARDAQGSRKKYAALSLVENYGWVRLGVQADAFPRTIANQMIHASSDSILEAYFFALDERLLPRSDAFENRRLIESMEYFPRVFRDAHESEFLSLPESATIFSLWAGEFKSFSRSQSVSEFVETINFSNEKEWHLSVVGLADDPFDPDGKKYSRVSLFEGYLRILQHLDRIADLLDVEGTASEKWPARAIMRIEMGSIHRWQLNFQNSVFEHRFSQVTGLFEKRIRQEAADDGTELEEGSFAAGIRDLIKHYLAAQEPLQAARALAR